MKNLFTTSYRHFNRYRQIINIISKHGLGHLLDYIGLKNPINFSKKRRPAKEIRTIAARITMVLEELGPTFIKLGQLLSMRPDLLPPVYISQLEKLQDRVAPVEFSEILHTIEWELAKPVSAIFAEIDPSPIAAASIGQVHRARLLTGDPVVVKVQRAGVWKLVETDLEILGDVARFLESRTGWGRYYNITALIDEFARAIRDELDYTIEAGNAERFGKNFLGDPTVRFPKVYWEYSSRKVLALEAISGLKPTDNAGLEKLKIDKTAVAQNLVNAILKQLLVDGFFHADPHPGNIVITQNGVILFLDFGMVGRLDAWLRQRMSLLLLNLVQENVTNIVDVLLEFGEVKEQINRRSLQRKIFYLFDKYYHRPLERIQIGAVLRELLELALVYRFKLPGELSLITRCLFLLESTVAKLTPGSSLLELSRPFGSKLLKERSSWQYLSKVAQNHLQDWLTFSLSLPGRLKKLLRLAESGELKLVMEHQHFDIFIARINLIGNRLAFSLIIAAIIVGSSLVAQKTPFSLFGNFPIAEAGFILAVLMGVWLLISIIRSGKI